MVWSLSHSVVWPFISLILLVSHPCVQNLRLYRLVAMYTLKSVCNYWVDAIGSEIFLPRRIFPLNFYVKKQMFVLLNYLTQLNIRPFHFLEILTVPVRLFLCVLCSRFAVSIKLYTINLLYNHCCIMSYLIIHVLFIYSQKHNSLQVYYWEWI